MDLIRKGSWIKVGNKVGIVIGFEPNGDVRYHIVNEEGFTLMELDPVKGKLSDVVEVAAAGKVKKAKIGDIPKSRIKGHTKASLQELGYES